MAFKSGIRIFVFCRVCAWGAACCVALLPLNTSAGEAPLQKMGVQENVGDRLPDGLEFTDHNGETVSLAEFLRDDKPLLLITAYYHCPMLCGLVLKGLAETVESLQWKPGEQFRVLTISFDPTDTPRDARKKRKVTLARAGLNSAESHWPFLVGNESAIDELLNALGVEVARDEASGEYAHPAVSYVSTPDGTISRYLYGIDFPPRDLKLALLKASDGATGSAFERVLMRCYAYDPATRRYGLFIDNFMRVGGVGILAALSLLLAGCWRWERRRGARDRVLTKDQSD